MTNDKWIQDEVPYPPWLNSKNSYFIVKGQMETRYFLNIICNQIESFKFLEEVEVIKGAAGTFAQKNQI